MMIYRAEHTTSYSYTDQVAQCLTEVRLKPRTAPRQILHHWRLVIDPCPDRLNSRSDYYGNEVSTFAVLEPHERLTVTAQSVIEVQSPPPVEASISWEAAREVLAVPADPAGLAASEFRWESPFVPWTQALTTYGKSAFMPGRPLAEAATELMGRIHREFKYSPNTTAIETPLATVLRERKGVCQDFAHVMIGVLRAHGLAARYVSGYLRSGASYQGAEASHAWVAVYVPGAGWLDFDPTNNVVPKNGHVTLAWGRDYGDVSPVKGVTVGGGEQRVDVKVKVSPVHGPDSLRRLNPQD